MINLTKEKYNELVEFLSDDNLIKILIDLIYKSKKSFMSVKDLDNNYYLFEIVSFKKLRDDIKINLINHNKESAVLYNHNSMIKRAGDLYHNKIIIFFNNTPIGVKTIKLIDSFDDALEYLV